LAIIFVISYENASADVITSLYNTGESVSGTALSDGSTDSHYTLVSNPSGALNAAVYAHIGVWPIGPSWTNGSTNADWITPNPILGYSANDAAGNYDYRTTFTLTGLDASTAAITGSWAADNLQVSILLNGSSTGIFLSPTNTNFQLSSFAISNGFVSGINTLDFVINNAPYAGLNPSGLLVEMSGTASPVPVPATIWLFGSALVGFLGFNRRKTS
jgi:hypothetical protein